MLYIITMLICFSTGILVKKTKILGFCGMMILAYLAGNANPMTTIDYSVYAAHYNLLGWEVSPFEKGYTILSQFFYNNGMDYAHFRLIFAFLAFIILFFGVCLFTNRVALFVGLYGTTVFFNDATQIRNLMMIALVILGSGLLAKSNKVIKLLGIISLLIATQFHDLGFVFLLVLAPLSFVNISVLKRFYKYIVALLFTFGIIFSVASNTAIIQIFASFLTKFSSRTNSAENVVTSFGRGNSHSTVILVWISLILLVIVLKIMMRMADQMKIGETVKIKMLFLGSSMALLVAFLIVLAPDYSRISRNAFLFLILFLCFIFEQKGNLYITKRNISKLVLILCLLIFTTYINTTLWGSTYYDSIPYLARIK